MKHSGKATKAAFRLILIALIVLLVIAGLGALAIPKGAPGWAFFGAAVALWVLFTGFTLYFFRDPDAARAGGRQPGAGAGDTARWM